MESEKQIKPRNTLAQRSVYALKWNYAGSLGRAGMQFLIGIVLARLLGPEPFGLVALASLVLGLGALFADVGLASVLIQRKEITDSDIRFIFTVQTLLGLILTLVLEAGVTVITDFFKRADAVPVLQWMFLLFFIQGMGQTSAALLRRRLDFRRLQLAQIVSYTVGYVGLGLPLAFNGFGVWSLVIAQLSQATMCTMLTYAMTKHPMSPLLTSASRSLLHVGLKLTATNLSNWALACMDSVLIGRVFGTTQLGLYNRAMSLVAMPTYHILSSVQSVLFSTSARMQEDTDRLRQTYLAVLGVIGFICLPIFFVVAAIPDTVIGGVYGAAWMAAVPILTPVALAMPMSALMGLGGPLMTGMGKAGTEMGVQFISLLMFIPFLWWASRFTLEAVAWSVFASYIVRFLLMTHATLVVLKARWCDVLRVLCGPLVLALLCATVTFIVDWALPAHAISAGMRLMVASMVAAAVALSGFLLGQRWLISTSVAPVLKQALSTMPIYVRRLIVV